MTTPRVGTEFGRYRIVRPLGHGGVGAVYEAYDTSKNRTVALKILAHRYATDSSYRNRFRQDVHDAAMLRAPHVVPIHDWGEIDGCLYVDMRLIEGQSLQRLIQDGPLPPQRAVALITQIGAALDAAHSLGLTHRDVKPQNIIVTPTDFAYLVDFGIAQPTDDAGVTSAGNQIDAVAHLAPERCRGQEATSAADVYALTCVLYTLLTGRAPFAATTLQQAITGHLSSPPPRPSAADPRLPAALDEVIAIGMAKDPQSRYPSAGAMCAAAQWALCTPAAPQHPPVPPPGFARALAATPIPAPRQPNSARPLAYAALAIAVIALVVAIGGHFVPAAPADGAAHSAAAPESAVAPAYTPQQAAAAKQKVCDATGLARAVVQTNTNMTNPVPGDPAGDLGVAANARLALAHSADYVRAELAKQPATPPDLTRTVNAYIDTLDALAMNYLAGKTAEEQGTLRDRLTDVVGELDSACE
ncbi:serine/threonine protein kinase [Mycobacterium sp. M1]|uniref:non-specific serine/threonine protein kinase n=1 Tax=Mycolicibacter acidiphilus TaxID=2835306 RepID=A0ABS5RN65_9MYCO|nr:serine/threonine-protein kinase [Mycolicibacter acidiphilus]MBS9535756.1 serine/threonine protein kinase [Mycolicibacter acidiphilus]